MHFPLLSMSPCSADNKKLPPVPPPPLKSANLHAQRCPVALFFAGEQR